MKIDKRKVKWEIILGIFSYPIENSLSLVLGGVLQNNILGIFVRFIIDLISVAGIILLIDGLLRLFDYNIKDLAEGIVKKIKSKLR